MISIVAILASLFGIHPFHVSVSDIRYKENQKVIQISTRIFLDDLEVALQAYTGNKKLDIADAKSWQLVNKNLERYVLEKMKLWDQKDRAYELNYIGAEIEENVMWCYIEIKRVKRLARVKIRNTLLIEIYGDQENLVHFRAFGGVQSTRLYKGDEMGVFEWPH